VPHDDQGSPPRNPVDSLTPKDTPNEPQERDNPDGALNFVEQVPTGCLSGEDSPRSKGQGQRPGYADVGTLNRKVKMQVGVKTL